MAFWFKKRKRDRIKKIVAQHENWLRFVTLIIHAGTAVLRDIFHCQGSKPTNPELLYIDLKIYKNKLSKDLFKDEYKLVFPKSKKSDSQEFDIALLKKLIRICTTIAKPKTGWDAKDLKENDHTTSADIVRLHEWRNETMHTTGRMSTKIFNKKWELAMNVLRRLGYNVKEVQGLKRGNLDEMEYFKVALIQAQLEDWKDCLDMCENEIGNLSDTVGNNTARIDQNRDSIALAQKQEQRLSADLTAEINLRQQSHEKLARDMQKLKTSLVFQDKITALEQKFEELLEKQKLMHIENLTSPLSSFSQGVTKKNTEACIPAPLIARKIYMHESTNSLFKSSSNLAEWTDKKRRKGSTSSLESSTSFQGVRKRSFCSSSSNLLRSASMKSLHNVVAATSHSNASCSSLNMEADHYSSILYPDVTVQNEDNNNGCLCGCYRRQKKKRRKGDMYEKLM
ncbi:E3 ubiquitin-protein ligase DZIP3-like [Hydractinia symbiolongicarpus]|uniref:E3 ubiquitin-protein ligase DZIP3-like n=1 Tax=Hydractinia symbiolongicarpus TaxID=13093 RepID=UPI00254BA999|nr:E3 ubiquitin-protein ligase DZIP3-like [Hydractinia symbiolongicarpus]